MFELPFHGLDQPERLLVSTHHDLAGFQIRQRDPPVLLPEPGFYFRVAHDDELPVLLIRPGRRLHGKAEQLQDHLVVDRIRTQAPDRALRRHRLDEIHVTVLGHEKNSSSAYASLLKNQASVTCPLSM